MIEIHYFEAFDKKRFVSKEECEKYEETTVKDFLKSGDITCYDDDLNLINFFSNNNKYSDIGEIFQYCAAISIKNKEAYEALSSYMRYDVDYVPPTDGFWYWDQGSEGWILGCEEYLHRKEEFEEFEKRYKTIYEEW